MPRRKQKAVVVEEEERVDLHEEMMPPRTSRKAKSKRKQETFSDMEEDEVPSTIVDEEEKSSKKKTKKSSSSSTKKTKTSSSRKKKKVESEEEEDEKDQTEDLMEDEEKNDTTANTASSTTPTEEEAMSEEQIEEQPEDAIGDLDLTKIHSENTFVTETIQNIIQFQSVLQNVESGYATLSSEDRHRILSILKYQQRKIGKLVEICNSAELLLFRGSNNDLSEYGILNKLDLVEVWGVIFSFLKFSDYLKAAQVCKLWKKASEEPYALSSLQFDFKSNFQHKHILEVYREYFEQRKEYIRYATDIPGHFLKYLSDHNIIFPNAKYLITCKIPSWEDELSYYSDETVEKVFPKYAMPHVNASSVEEFGFLRGFLPVSPEKTIVVPASTKCAKLGTRFVKFENPDNIIKLAISICDEDKLPQFPNLTELDLSLHLSPFNDDIMLNYKFGEKVKTLGVCYHATIQDVKRYLPSLSQIETIRLSEVGLNKRLFSIGCHLTSFNNLTELDAETMYESHLEAIAPRLKRLKISKILEKKGKIFSHLTNVEALCITEQVLTNPNDLPKLTKLKTLQISNNSNNHNKQITIDSASLETLILLTFNSITINCPNLYYLLISGGLKNGSESVYITSHKLSLFRLDRDVQSLSIKGPNLFSDGSILERVKSIVDLECPLIESAHILSASSITQSDSFKTLLVRQIKTLRISACTLQIFEYKTQIQNLFIDGWKSISKISQTKMALYRQNTQTVRQLSLQGCSIEVVKSINNLFRESDGIENLSILETNYDSEVLDSITNSSKYYLNLNELHLRNIVGFKPATMNQFLKQLDSRTKLKTLECILKATYKKYIPTHIPIHVEKYIGSIGGVENAPANNVTSLTIPSGCMHMEADEFQHFPNLTFLKLEQIFVDSTMLKYLKKVKILVLSAYNALLLKLHKEENPDQTIYFE
ncbi:hypothetical protein C9374_008271 [Naegleria lovaniensis]|uniref:F-box domain-containing protein n=1 Tax=Naegleria lovaniensis TaxID=51637 RepID=A0AA88GJQ3_NAELO|nr:uncharacterized protein C9374_008271 [Naegleria lovaniensis]KAG2378632.1 hypothetical protein C9374_008271 [Naegleria lovaniensis]